MHKSILYRLFGIGSVPKRLRPVLEQEGIVAIDEGLRGRLVTKHLSGPGKRYRLRAEGFSGCLAVTKARVVCYTYWKRQINIAVEDPKLTMLYVDTPSEHTLCLSFESSNFRDGWQGVIEFWFKTDKALSLRDALVAIGAQRGTAADAEQPHR